MPKDLMNALRAIQEEGAGDHLISPNHVKIDMEEHDSHYMQDFFKQIEEIRSLIDKIEGLISTVRSKHKDLKAAPINNDTTKKQLEETMFEIRQLSTKVRSKLKDIEPEEEDPDNVNADLRIRKTQHAALVRKFLNVMNEYNSCQVEFMDESKLFIQKKLAVAGKQITMNELEDLLDSEKPQIFTQGIISSTMEAKQSLAEIESRHADILKLEQSIKELHDLFLDMAVLVEQQGEMVDRIEHNVQQSKDYVEKAKNDTKAAVNHKRSANKKKCIIIGVVCGILFIVIIAIILSFTV